MSEHKAVSTKKPVPGANSSRTIVIVVVVALIVIAVGGIVLAGRNSGETWNSPRREPRRCAMR